MLEHGRPIPVILQPHPKINRYVTLGKHVYIKVVIFNESTGRGYL